MGIVAPTTPHGCVWILLLKFKRKVDSVNRGQVVQFETSSFENLYSKIPESMTQTLFPKVYENSGFHSKL